MLMENDRTKSRDLHLAPSQVLYDALVLNASLRPSLVTMRSLGSRGLQVATLETSDALPAPAFSSRWSH